MTPEEAIDAVIRDYDGADPDDADNDPRRLRLLGYLQHIHDYVWNYRAWEWTYKEGTALNIANGANSVALPADFLEFGHSGYLFDAANDVYYREISRRRGGLMRRPGVAVNGPVRGFSIFAGKVQLPFTVSGSTLSLTPFYRYRAPVLADNSTQMAIPDRYAYTVIIPGVVFRAQESKNDARPGWGGQFRDGLAQMCAIENPLKTGDAVRLPMTNPGMW